MRREKYKIGIFFGWLAGVLCLSAVLWCGAVQGKPTEDQDHIRRLLRWERHVQSPFLLPGEQQLTRLYQTEKEGPVAALRSALLERAQSYGDPESPFYLGAAAWEAGGPLLLRQSTLPMIRYYNTALLDMAFATYFEEGREIRPKGARLLQRTMNELRSDSGIALGASAADTLVPNSELLAGLALAYDLLARSFDAKDRAPFLAALEEERAFLCAVARRRLAEVRRPAQQVDIAACLALVTLFSSATAADRESPRAYRNLYREFVTDLLWATDTLCQAWEELDTPVRNASLDDLEYPAFHTLAYVEALQRLGGPNLLPALPVGSIVTAVQDRRLPEQALVIDRTSTDLDTAAPDTWPPALRNLFWKKGDGADTDAPISPTAAKPAPTPTPRQVVRFARRLREIQSKKPAPTPTPTPVIGWSPSRRAGVPSLWGPILLLLAGRGDALALEIWRSGGELLSSHPATLAWQMPVSRAAPTARRQDPSVWSDREGALSMIRSFDAEGPLFAREVSPEGQSAGDYLIKKQFRRRILERVEVSAAGDVIGGTDVQLRSAGHVLSIQQQGGFEWTTALRTPGALGLPYFVSVVRASSDTVGRYRLDLPLQGSEEITSTTSTPRLITLTYQEQTTSAGLTQRLPFSTGERHLRVILSSARGAGGLAGTEGEARFLRAVQPLESGAALVALIMDDWPVDRFSVEPAELEKGFGVVIPWKTKGYDLIAVNTGEGIRGPTIETDARYVVLSWDVTHDRVAYLVVEGTFLRATSSLRKGPLRTLIEGTRQPVTVSWYGQSLVFAEGCGTHGIFYAPGLRLARRGTDRLFAYRRNNRVTLSERPAQTYRVRTINAESRTR